MRRKIALCLLAAWILLFAFCFAEQFGYFHDTDEYADQSIELSLSSPAYIDSHNVNEQLASFASVAFIGIALAITLSSNPAVSKNISLFDLYRLPDSSKIYQFISTYRI